MNKIHSTKPPWAKIKKCPGLQKSDIFTSTSTKVKPVMLQVKCSSSRSLWTPLWTNWREWETEVWLTVCGVLFITLTASPPSCSSLQSRARSSDLPVHAEEELTSRLPFALTQSKIFPPSCMAWAIHCGCGYAGVESVKSFSLGQWLFRRLLLKLNLSGDGHCSMQWKNKQLHQPLELEFLCSSQSVHACSGCYILSLGNCFHHWSFFLFLFISLSWSFKAQ